MTALQIVITIWLNASHPFTFTLPHIYPLMEREACEQRLGYILQHRKNKKLHMELGCVPTDKRNA